ncbi:MAG: hypothetical protein HOD92_06335 [Deltaproteobacteria bacterium]|jgi:hypothetical protein|nr:hypothetical protein [Deltaproteobacteria bacterium]
MRHNFIYLLIVLLVFLFACRNTDIETVTTLAPPVSGQGNIVHSSAEGGEWPFVYSHNIGSTPKDVYFIFTNPTYTTFSSDINVQSNSYYPSNSNEISSDSLNVNDGNIETSDHPINAIPDYISEFNNHPPPLIYKDDDLGTMQLNLEEVLPPQLAVVGDPEVFNESIDNDTVNSKCRATRDLSSDISLNIWVADADFTGGSCGADCMTTSMAEAFLDKFLWDGTSDIYGWVTNMIGGPWGSHSYNNLIPATSKNTIDILFYDIPAIAGGTIIGYFHAKDNYLVGSEPTSNQRLIFYMDSVLAATASGGDGWHISDDYPALVLSTLSHEFQHMIHFYQKPVLRASGASSQDWLNEMSSLMSEDLMSSKLEVNGPRGVTHSDFSAGSSGNGDGRLPGYIYYNDESAVIWDAFYSYSVNYALGAYLLRNFGGANFLKHLVQSPFTNTGAIDYALSQMGYDFNFSDILQRWGVSVLLSDQLDTSQYYRYNTGVSFDTNMGTTTYQIGSINMYNYTIFGQTGPKTVSISDLPDLNYHKAASNVLVKAGTQLTGTKEWTIKMGRDIKLSVVLK